MIENKDKSAFPWSNEQYIAKGLTKKEYFTAMIIQGLCANPSLTSNNEQTAKVAIAIASDVLYLLDKSENKK